jgi:hypothetical protein
MGRQPQPKSGVFNRQTRVNYWLVAVLIGLLAAWALLVLAVVRVYG